MPWRNEDRRRVKDLELGAGSKFAFCARAWGEVNEPLSHSGL